MHEQEGTAVSRSTVHTKVTEEIIAAIAAGAPKFEMPWHRSGTPLGRPTNALSRMPYRGVNVLALWVAAQKKGYSSGVWATYRQWKKLDAQVRKGESGTVIVFFKEIERPQEGEEPDPGSSDAVLIARASWVFNADQVTGWKAPEPPFVSVAETINRAEELIDASGACIDFGHDHACYDKILDLIEMPDRERFIATSTSNATEAYYATQFHELTHWTGHPSRLNRDLSDRFGDNAYAIEELVAELGAAFLCADLGVTNVPRPDHGAYVSSWLRVLHNDTRAIFAAAAKAHGAAEYLTTLHTRAYPHRKAGAHYSNRAHPQTRHNPKEGSPDV
jgi:antirestriction protein ArdC